MFYAYVIKSVNHHYFYKGHCKDLAIRLQQHNSGMTKSIKPYLPFEIIYFEEFETQKEDIGRDKYFKSAVKKFFQHICLVIAGPVRNRFSKFKYCV